VNVSLLGHLSTAALLTLALHWLALWLGLYLLSRRPFSAANGLIGLGFVVVSAYLLCTAVGYAPASVAATVFWGKWLGSWVTLAPVLLLHACTLVTGTRLPRQRVTLALIYAMAGFICLITLSDTLVYRDPTGTETVVSANAFIQRGPLYPLYMSVIIVTLVLALAVLLRARFAQASASGPARAHLSALIVGTALILLGACLIFANVYANWSPNEGYFQSVLVLGLLVVAVPLARYSGLLGGRLLRSDLRSSLLGAGVVMAGFLALALAVSNHLAVVAGLGWFVVAVFALGDDLRALADRAFFGASSRAGRAGLRTAASYAGSLDPLDLATLSPGQSAEVISYLGTVDRASRASAQLEGPGDARLALLGRKEFGAVRCALGLPPEWTPNEGLPREEVRARIAATLEPRERQALGLKYLGYSDKEMAQLMGVRPNVPRNYLCEGKRKLGLPAGAPLMLFVYLSGLVDSDALPLLAPAQAAPAALEEAAQISTSAAAEELA